MSGRLDVRVQRSAHRPGDEVTLLVDSVTAGTADVVTTHLGPVVRVQDAEVVPGRTHVSVGCFDPGSYAVRVTSGEAVATTAFDVLADPLSRPRYGFVADFRPGRSDAAQLADSLRELHVNAVQLYDWMYRHAELVPPSDEFTDALGRPLSLVTVRAVVAAAHAAGAQALGYAAVYGAGEEYAGAHPEQVLHRRGGVAWMLADFLWIMDVTPGSPWTRHMVGEMARAVREVGLDGLHLDQYGAPQVALTGDGEVVDLAAALPAFVDAVRDALPSSTLIFNNVNDFPTRQTVTARQDATYIEVWPPHETYADLVRLVDVARDLAPARPVILAAYLAPFAGAGGEPELAAATLALATVWAAGGQYLLFGEVHGILVDPYYPSFAMLSDRAVTVLRSFADFAVANGDLLFTADSRETTGGAALAVDADVRLDGAPVSLRPRAGSIWLRTSRIGHRLVVQLVDYRHQDDDRWNVPRTAGGLVRGLRLRLRVVSAQPRVRFGHPSGGPGLADLVVQDEGDTVVVEIPDFDTWAVVLVDR